jgi:hypothetical protein
VRSVRVTESTDGGSGIHGLARTNLLKRQLFSSRLPSVRRARAQRPRPSFRSRGAPRSALVSCYAVSRSTTAISSSSPKGFTR